MSPAAPSADADFEQSLLALASRTRLAILRALRTPRALREIEVLSADEEGGRERVISRQAVRVHLERLMDAGLVGARESAREYGATLEYSLNHQALYALAEELRTLARLRPAAEPGGATEVASGEGEAGRIAGPCLVLVKGVDEGRAFSLRPPDGLASCEWRIGRRRDLEVPLDFDPFVSAEHAAVAWDGARHVLVDREGSRNGTLLNFAPIPKGVPRPLASGDIVGVGATLLVYRA